MSEGSGALPGTRPASRTRAQAQSEMSGGGGGGRPGDTAGGTCSLSAASSSASPTRVTAVAASASAEARAALAFGDGYHRILEAIGNPGYYSMKALFYGEDGPPGDTIPSITVSFELFEAVQNRFAATKATLESTKAELHARHQQYAVLEGQHEQLQESYSLLEMRASELERKNTQLLQDVAKQDVMAELLRQQITRMKSEAEMIEDKMAKREEELQVLHSRVAEGLVSLSQKETIIANLRRQLGYGGLLKRDGVLGSVGGEGDEYSPEALERITNSVEGRSAEARLRLCVVELEAQVRSVTEEKKYVMLRHTMYRKHVQDVTESYEALCMSREDAVGSHRCESPLGFSAAAAASSAATGAHHTTPSNASVASPLHSATQHLLNASKSAAHEGPQPPEQAGEERRPSCGDRDGDGALGQDESIKTEQAFEETAVPPKFSDLDSQTRLSDSSSHGAPVPPMAPAELQSMQDSRLLSPSQSHAANVGEGSTSKESGRSRESRKKSLRQPEKPDSADRLSTTSPLPSRLSGPQGLAASYEPSQWGPTGTVTTDTANTKAVEVREQGTQTSWRLGRQSASSVQLPLHSPGQGRPSVASSHNPTSRSTSSVFGAAPRPGEGSPSRLSQLAAPTEKGGTPQRGSSLVGAFGVMLPTFEQEHREADEELKNEFPARQASEDRSHSGRASQEKGEVVERTRSATNRAVRSLARKYVDLHAALLDLEELVVRSKGGEPPGGTKSTPFYADINNESAGAQAEYLSSVVVADTLLLLQLLHRLQRSRSGSAQPLPNRASVGALSSNAPRQASDVPIGAQEKAMDSARDATSAPTSMAKLRPTEVEAAGTSAEAATSARKVQPRRPEGPAGRAKTSEKASASGKIGAAEKLGATGKLGAAEKPSASGKLGAAEKPSATGKLGAAEKLSASPRADVSWKSSVAERAAGSSEAVAVGSLPAPAGGGVTGTAGSDARKGDKGGPMHAAHAAAKGDLRASAKKWLQVMLHV
ncbi:uncharacterized protein Tco025E_01117 [Trypanosoma conorhini]|uniref:Uncharacterized protein n=1 Tax=Trypanosoma conorhini TaxID=83891 RepID=A0A3R7P049_9TRYP|nr:uncharacterized protein Tco025E_01117 [Trypanosoma conorhini]RNF26655.1 hypothetical protein Tco025E_01117 [Trypanosoma conorhini]